MLNMRTVVKARKISDQTQATDRSPANVFDETIVDVGMGSDHHGAAGKFAVAESDEQAGTRIEIFFVVGAHRERAAIETGQRQENRGDVSQLSPAAEMASAHRSHVGREAHAEQSE